MRSFITGIAAIVVFRSVLGCAPADDGSCAATYRYQSQFHYDIRIDEITETGIRVDRTGQNYPSLEMIDRLVDDVEDCLVEKYGDPPTLPESVMEAYDCRSSTFAFPFFRECITVKIPDDWFVSSDGTQELLSFAGPWQGCKQKNPEHEEDDGCFWRAGLQCSNTIVSTPSLYVFKDPLIRMATGCNNPWGVDIDEEGNGINLGAELPAELRLSHCASPGTSDVPARSTLPARSRPDGFLGHEVDFSRTSCGY